MMTIMIIMVTCLVLNKKSSSVDECRHRVLDSGSMNSESSESHFIALTCVCTLDINFQNSLQ